MSQKDQRSGVILLEDGKGTRSNHSFHNLARSAGCCSLLQPVCLQQQWTEIRYETMELCLVVPPPPPLYRLRDNIIVTARPGMAQVSWLAKQVSDRQPCQKFAPTKLYS